MPPTPDQNPDNSADESLRQLWDWNFTNHTPTPEAIKKIEGLRATAKSMKDAIIAMTPHSRERSIALTNLEQTLFYAVAAVARTETLDGAEIPEEDKHLHDNTDKETK